jgi:hypothetical protein
MSKRTKAGRKRSFRNHLTPFLMAGMVRQSKAGWARWKADRGRSLMWFL